MERHTLVLNILQIVSDSLNLLNPERSFSIGSQLLVTKEMGSGDAFVEGGGSIHVIISTKKGSHLILVLFAGNTMELLLQIVVLNGKNTGSHGE